MTIKIQVDTAVEVFVNVAPLISSADFVTIDETIAYNEAGMDLNWNFQTPAGVVTQTNVTPTTGGVHDWTHVGNGMYKIEIPAAAGTINNDTEGTGWFSGVCTGVLPWISERYECLPANQIGGLLTGADYLDVNTAQIEGADPTDTVRDSLVDDATRFSGADIAAILTDTGTTLPADIAALNDPTSAAIADAVWDEVLTAATHNVPTSAGRRLRALQDFQGYEDGAIWIDTVNGAAGTTNYENGTVENPVDSIADANTLATSLGFTRFRIAPASTLTFAVAQNNQEFDGDNWALNLNGQSVSGTHIHGATVSGNDDGSNVAASHYTNCVMGTNALGLHTLERCGLSGTITLAEAGTYDWITCHSRVAGTGTPGVDVGVAVANTNLNMRRYSGGIEVQNIGQAGVDNMSLEGNGQLVLNANCSGGTIAIRGCFTVTDNAGGVVTLTDDARYDVAQINTECDTALADYDGPTNAEMVARTLLAAQYGTAANQTNIETDTQDIQTRLPAALVGGAMDSSVSAIDAATANTIADHTLRRTFANAWGSADGDAQTFRSLVGAVAKLVNRIRINAGVLTIYEDDDVTVVDTQTVTTDAAADPVVELDTT